MERMAHDDAADKYAFIGELYIEYEQELYAFANGILKDVYWAEDAVHRTFVSVMENMDRLDMSDSVKVKSLLYTMLRNHCFNEKKKKKRCVYEPDVMAEREITVTDSGFDYPELAELMDKMRNISEEYTEILFYRGVCGLKTSQLARLFGISDAAARKKLSRARKVMKRELGDDYHL